MLETRNLYKVGQCIRLRKYANAGLVGACILAAEKMGTSYEYKPHYVHLRITEAKAPDVERTPQGFVVISLDETIQLIGGVDLVTLEKRGFEYRRSNWYEVDPQNPRKSKSLWGFDEITILSAEDVRDIIDRHQAELDDIASNARSYAQTYRTQTEAILRSW